MNDLLHLKGRFEERPNSSRQGSAKLPKNSKVKLKHLENLKIQLEQLLDFWEKNTLITNALISVYYKTIIAKSNRIKNLFSKNGKKANDTIVGAKFDSKQEKHIITYCISISTLKSSIKKISECIFILKNQFNNEIDYILLEKVTSKLIKLKSDNISKSSFAEIIVDCYYIEKFDLDQNVNNINENAIVTIYNTGTNTIELMNRIGIQIQQPKAIDDTTILLTPPEFLILKEKAPYLISMAVSDINLLEKEDFNIKSTDQPLNIPSPTNEPIIGVIDTLFDSKVYFSEWVEFVNMIDENIETNSQDYIHGTEVTSIIVDGPSFNPNLNDGCGRFRVKHFGVATNGRFSSFTILKNIKEIIAKNRDIKVWNLSLGSSMEINPNFISPEAAILDQIQYEFDVLFIIAGTNKPSNFTVEKLGAPADSLNAIVVNSVDFNNKPASYSRKGKVLSFFNKPDISYYGGDENKGICVCTPCGANYVQGTSFAAPWITRKVAYLIYIMGFTKEVAKALIIDSATEWNKITEPSNVTGYGIVPINIKDIIQSQNDEIKFILFGTSTKYDTYNYNIPIPIHKDKYPYIAKATLCYFPKCSRNQGVDYTNTEMDLHFGRIAEKSIKDINHNTQTDSTEHHLYESEARKIFRKWDNVKHIGEELKEKCRPKKVYPTQTWGISIKTKERLNNSDGVNLKFGIVITLKEINGNNRIDEFIHQCNLKGWIVNRLNVTNSIEIHNRAEEIIDLE